MSDGNPLGREAPAARADNQDPAVFGQTPWQTVGPFFHYGLPWKGGADLVGVSDLGARPDLVPDGHFVLHAAPPKGDIAGDRIEIFGLVRDGDGAPVPDAMLEIWQADADGHYATGGTRHGIAPHSGFIGFGRAATDADGRYLFRTIRPGRVPGPGNQLQAPHLAMGVFGRGLLKRLVTRVYFADEAANAEDKVLDLVPANRRDTLLARADGPGRWRFDVVLCGAGETVFFEV